MDLDNDALDALVNSLPPGQQPQLRRICTARRQPSPIENNGWQPELHTHLTPAHIQMRLAFSTVIDIRESWLQALHGDGTSTGGLTGGTGATKRQDSSEVPQSHLQSSQAGSASASASASQSHHDHMTSRMMGPLASTVSNASQATSHEHASNAAEPYLPPAAPAAQHAAAHAAAAAPTRSDEAASAAVSLAQTEFGHMSATEYAAFIRQQRAYGAGAVQRNAQPAHAAAGAADAAGPSGSDGRNV